MSMMKYNGDFTYCLQTREGKEPLAYFQPAHISTRIFPSRDCDYIGLQPDELVPGMVYSGSLTCFVSVRNDFVNLNANVIIFKN